MRRAGYVLLLWFVDFMKLTNPQSTKFRIEAWVWNALTDASSDALTLFDCTCSNCRLCETKRNFVL
jgi:hypothetical protein